MSDLARTVLVVDDDPQILRLVERMLGSHGVRVITAARAAEALRICEREPIDLLISDVVMPEMDGPKLAERFLKLRPGASVLLISGDPRDPVLPKSGRVRFLRKPFFPSDLLRNLRELVPGM
jgi:two-component system, cell cycle sensor histidine kinase and response regulator CckA